MSNSSQVAQILKEGLDCISKVQTSKELEDLRVSLLGKKGSLTDALKIIKDLPADEKKAYGDEVNRAKEELTLVLDSRKARLSEEEELLQLNKEWIDVTLPVEISSAPKNVGHIHPLSHVQKELEEIFLGLGFDVVDGPEVESEFYNFEALNIPDWHPARDMQDTIWTTLPGILLRTQTSPMQIRAMLERKAPLRIVAPGRCFRYERMDATHEHTFYQMEGMMIDKKVHVGHLTYFMKTLLSEIFGFEPKIRLRPGYFPFVEPGFELDIWFNNKWLELLPCGLIHPKVLEYGGIDPKEYQGFAFGLGLSRLVMTRFQIDDIRHLQGGDARFLSQF
jgi:phenylalanyl-tRNA synthetase alpha chain